MDTVHLTFAFLNVDSDQMQAFRALRLRLYDSAFPEFISSDAECMMSRHDGEPVARLSTQIVEGLHGAPGKTGLIGHYEAFEREAGMALLREAQKKLSQAGVVRILGPMNGSTWARYRLALPRESGDPSFHPPTFLGEPQNPSTYPEHFLQSGFSVAAQYETRIVEDVSKRYPKAEAIGNRLVKHGITVRRFDVARYDEEIRKIYFLCLRSFTNNLYYKPIDYVSFSEIYRRFYHLLEPDLVLLVENAKESLIAFIFAYPDFFSVDKSGHPTRVVLKSLACAPEVRVTGLGIYLIDEIHRIAHKKGYRAALHALMHVKHNSRRLSIRGYDSVIFRRYALYEWNL